MSDDWLEEYAPLPALPSGLVFLDNPSEFREPEAMVVHLPHGIRSKEKLFAVYADKLSFPGYFGWNWDAFEECLNDLSWLPQQSVALIHNDLPFGERGPNRRTYLDILRRAAARPVGKIRALTVVWPKHLQSQINPAASEQR